MIATHIKEFEGGRIVEYRRSPYDPGILHVECRVLRGDCTPYDDRWWPISGEGWSILQRHAPGMFALLWADRPDAGSGEGAAS
jgi:hypothetical protein